MTSRMIAVKAVPPGQGRERELAWEAAVVLPDAGDLDDLANVRSALGSGSAALNAARSDSAISIVNGRLKTSAFGVSEGRYGAPVPERDVALRVGRDDRVTSGLRDRGESEVSTRDGPTGREGCPSCS